MRNHSFDIVSQRTAYTLEVQVNVSEYQPTPEELELIKERPFNIKMLEKLESMYYINPKVSLFVIFDV